MARVVIEDDGPGMDRQTLALACQPFHSTRRAEGGHGLGLAMVDRFVRDHGGHLHIDSEPGRGTRVELLLPAPAVAQWPAGAAAEPPCAETLHGPALAALGHGGPVEVPQVKSQRLLYVDDDAVLRQVVGHVLGTAGYEVTMAETLVEARALLRPGGASFDVVVSDVYLPDGTGFDVLDCWRALRRPGRAYLVSGRTGEDLRQRAGQHGALALIPKDRFFDPATPFASMDRLAAAAEPSCPPAA
jgi:CheY-like chemotaxis protein